MLTADDILKEDDLPIQEVKVPEWGGTVYVRSLRADERDAFESEWIGIRDAQGSQIGFRAFTVAYCLCDVHGKRLFDRPLDVYRKIGQRNAKGVSRVFDVAAKCNGVTKSDQEELEKN